MLKVTATAYARNLIDNEAGRIRNQTARHGDEAVIGKSIGLPDTDIHHLAFPDIQHVLVRPCYGLKLANETQPAKDIQLLAGELFDPKFFRIDGPLVDHNHPVPGTREGGPAYRSRRPAP